MLGRWDKWIVDQASDVPSIFFFKILCNILCKNPFNLFSYFSYKITKIKIKSFECLKSIKSMKKNTWTLGRRFVCPIVQANQRNILQNDRFYIILIIYNFLMSISDSLLINPSIPLCTAKHAHHEIMLWENVWLLHNYLHT